MTPADEVNGVCVHVVDAQHVSKQGCSRGLVLILDGAYESAHGSVLGCDRVATGSLQE